MKKRYYFLFPLIVFSQIQCTFDGLPQKTDRMIREFRQNDLFSGTALIAYEGDIIYNQGFGYIDREKKIPNTPQSQLKIGSIVKDFTAVVILQLMEQGKLDLDDPIMNYVDDFPENVARQVTIRQLLRHESGFGDYLMLPQTREKINSLPTVQSIVDLFKTEPLLFEPGTAQEYSNSGYTVLGAIIENITGKTYFEVVKEQILNPLEMYSTVFNWKIIEKIYPAPKWYLKSSTGNFYRSPFNELPSPSGGAYSTGEDLLKFEWSLLRTDKIISDKSKILLTTRFEKNSGKTWQEIINNPDFVSAKAGGAPGTNSVIIDDYSRNYVIIVLANYDEPIAEIIGKNIHNLIKGQNYALPKETIFEKCYQLYKSGNSELLKNSFADLVKEYASEDPPDDILNRIGYDLLNENSISEAVDIFTINTELFPDVANTWDSLGEAYMLAGDNAQSIKYYKKSLELNPENENAINMIRKVENKM